MSRPPDVDPDRIYQVMSRIPTPTLEKAAREIADDLGKPVSAALIKHAIARHPEWQIKLAHGGDRINAMDYACERALGKVEEIDKSSHDWIMLTAYERIQAGRLAPGKPTATKAEKYVRRKLQLGLVVDYNPQCGFFERIALPWEVEAKSYLKMPWPQYARLELETALSEQGLRQDIRDFWQRQLDNDRAITGILPAMGEG